MPRPPPRTGKVRRTPTDPAYLMPVAHALVQVDRDVERPPDALLLSRAVGGPPRASGRRVYDPAVSWGCPHEIHGVCQRVRAAQCDPGLLGCVV